MSITLMGEGELPVLIRCLTMCMVIGHLAIASEPTEAQSTPPSTMKSLQVPPAKDKKPVLEPVRPDVRVEVTGHIPFAPVSPEEQGWFQEMYGILNLSNAERKELEGDWDRKTHATRSRTYEVYRKVVAAHFKVAAQAGDTVTAEEREWFPTIFGSPSLAPDARNTLESLWNRMTHAERKAVYDAHAEIIGSLSPKNGNTTGPVGTAKADSKESPKQANDGLDSADALKAKEQKWHDEMYDGVDLTVEERDNVERVWTKLSHEERQKSHEEFNRAVEGIAAKPAN